MREDLVKRHLAAALAATTLNALGLVLATARAELTGDEYKALLYWLLHPDERPAT
jgi:hypothetical protein